MPRTSSADSGVFVRGATVDLMIDRVRRRLTTASPQGIVLQQPIPGNLDCGVDGNVVRVDPVLDRAKTQPGWIRAREDAQSLLRRRPKKHDPARRRAPPIRE